MHYSATVYVAVMVLRVRQVSEGLETENRGVAGVMRRGGAGIETEELTFRLCLTR